MKVLTYITAIAAFVFGMNTTNAATIENTNTVVEAIGGAVSARMDRSGETITVDMKVDAPERVLIQLKGKDGELAFESVVLVDTNGYSLDIDMTEFNTGAFTLQVKGKSLNYLGRFKNK